MFEKKNVFLNFQNLAGLRLVGEVDNHVAIYGSKVAEGFQRSNVGLVSFCEMNATKFGSKNYFSHIIIYHYMISYGYIIMVIVDSCMILFYFDCIMQLKKLHHIATNVCSRKSATTFGDLPDC